MLYKKYHRNFVRQFKKGSKVRFLIAQQHDLVRGKFFTILELRINYGVDVIFANENRIRSATLINQDGRLKTRTLELVY